MAQADQVLSFSPGARVKWANGAQISPLAALSGLLLVCGPILAAPLAAGLWTWRTTPRADLAVAAGAAAALAVASFETLALRRRGVFRDAAMLVLSAFWVITVFLGLSTHTGDWTFPPAWRAPGAHGWMAIMLGVLIYLILYGFACARRRRHQS